MNLLSESKELHDIEQKIQHGERLSFEDGVRLFGSNDLPQLGYLANLVRERLHGKNVFYARNLHMNHTNICTAHCIFCAFAKRPAEAGGYALTHGEILRAIDAAIQKFNINEVHIVGGLNPALDLNYYVELIGQIRRVFPEIFIKALTAVEIDDLAERANSSWEAVLKQLIVAGLNSLPGGGAEIFNESTRRRICAHKTSSERWLEIHKTVHRLGLVSNATMLYGHVESIEDRVDHLLRLRSLQDESGGFQAFVPFPFNAEFTPLAKKGEADGFTDLKVFAVSRLMLDNIAHIKVHWSSLDLKLAQVALCFGADDFGGLNLSEKIMHDAGNESPTQISEDRLRRLIESAGFTPVCVTSAY